MKRENNNQPFDKEILVTKIPSGGMATAKIEITENNIEDGQEVAVYKLVAVKTMVVKRSLE